MTTIDTAETTSPAFAQQAEPSNRESKSTLLSVVVPTFNEVGNVGELVRRLDLVLRDIAWEVVFVDDDSTDGTLDALRALSKHDARVRCIHRIGRRGLSSAVVEGILSSCSPLVAVMDADLQHDEAKLPLMLKPILDGSADMVVGSRYIGGGGIGDWSRRRASISRFATQLVHRSLPVPIADPMSGFFVLRREIFDGAVRRLSSQGYKILLDIMLSSPRTIAIEEVAYEFRSRVSGESKLDASVIIDFVALLIDKMFGNVIQGRFVLFCLVGTTGIAVHLLFLAMLLKFNLFFTRAQLIATAVAITYNFFLNNMLTYRDKRIRGAGPLLRGLFSFFLVCSLGAVSNLGLASFLYAHHNPWWVAALGGILLGVVWNYTMTATFTWRR